MVKINNAPGKAIYPERVSCEHHRKARPLEHNVHEILAAYIHIEKLGIFRSFCIRTIFEKIPWHMVHNQI